MFRKSLAKHIRSEAWELGTDRILPGYVYKTHAPADELPADFDGRVVFLFGKASDAALSVISCRDRYGEDWITEHLQHLRATGTIEELCDHDILQFDKQIETWTNVERHDVLSLRYETLWDNVDVLSKFLDFEVELPERRTRTAYNLIDTETVDRVRQTYEYLDNKIAAMPDYMLNRSNY